MAALAGNLVCAESVMALKDLLDGLGVGSRDCRQEGAKIDAKHRGDYIFNSTIAGIEQADVLVGAGDKHISLAQKSVIQGFVAQYISNGSDT